MSAPATTQPTEQTTIARLRQAYQDRVHQNEQLAAEAQARGDSASMYEYTQRAGGWMEAIKVLDAVAVSAGEGR